jgi:hypothetical protein
MIMLICDTTPLATRCAGTRRHSHRANHAFLDRAPPESFFNHRRADLHGLVHHRLDLLGVRFERAAKER